MLVTAGVIYGLKGTSKNSCSAPVAASSNRDGMIWQARMAQLGFFDAEKRLAALSAKGDPLEAIDRLVPWESFRADIEAVVLTPDEMRKSNSGRKPVDAIVMFRMLVLAGPAQSAIRKVERGDDRT